tara:strand:- start:3032 stop:3214 length:183 start_codon:yes stop_codon:yes gene_type:complete
VFVVVSLKNVFYKNCLGFLKFFKETFDTAERDCAFVSLPLFPHYSLVLLEEIVGVEETSS